MSDALAALLLGAVAGLGVAMPLGAVGVLLLRTGMTHGWRPAGAAALGVATVDLGYAAVAVAAGAAVTAALDGHERPVRLVGAAVLAAIALRGLLRARRPAADVGPEPPARPGPTYARFVGLTAVNPLTAVYFAVVAAGFAHRLDGTVPSVAFVLGVGAASAAWQLALAGAGSAAGMRAGPRARAWFGTAGDLVVLGLAVALAVS